MTPSLTPSVVRHIDAANSRSMSSGLAALAAQNIAAKRARMARQHRARMAADARRAAPGTLAEAARPLDVPVPFKTEPKRRRVVKATTAAPAPAETVYRPIKAADIPADCRALTSQHKRAGDLSARWFPVGVMTRDGSDVRIFARLHGSSVRYATA